MRIRGPTPRKFAKAAATLKTRTELARRDRRPGASIRAALGGSRQAIRFRPDLTSSPLHLDPQWMLLGLGHQQDLALLLFGDLKGVGARNAFTLRMDGQGKGQSIYHRSM